VAVRPSRSRLALLRTLFVQQWFTLNALAMQEAQLEAAVV